MRFRSLRVTLLFWYALILVGSMAVLGTTLHRQMRSVLYHEADAQIADWTDALRDVVTRDSSTLEADARAALPDGVRFAVFDASGRVRVASIGFEPGTLPTESTVVTRDHHRWRAEPLGSDAGWLVVGRSVREENHGIRQFLITLLATGAVVIVVALGGGYLLLSRVLAPAAEIGRTARRISAHNLSERIPLERVPTELRDVAAALNESFRRLDEAFEAQTAFTADASHELRTPLAILSTHLELAATIEQDAGQHRERLRVCRDAVQRMSGMVAGLLTLARADSGQVPFESKELELHALVEAEIDAMQPLADRVGVELECRVSPVAMRGDAGRLREVVSNLLDNAIRYLEDGGRVMVTLDREGAEAVLRVADTGGGVPEEHRERVFERFFRVDPARSRGGTGLGLAIVRWIVEAHGGTVAVEGEAGVGAEFVVQLPLNRAVR